MGKPLKYGEYEAHLQDMPFLYRITISYTPVFDTCRSNRYPYPSLRSSDVFE